MVKLYKRFSRVFLLLTCLSFFSGKLASQNITFDNVPPLSGGGNTAGGQAFNLTTNQSITILNLRGSFSAVSGTVTVWYNPVKINGTPSVTLTNGWINLGSAPMTGISPSNTNPTPQTVPVNLNLNMNPGDTFGFMIQWTGNVYPTTNTTIPTFTNGTVTIIADASCAYTSNAAMTTWFNPRQINGGVVYKLNAKAPNDAGITGLVSPVNFCPGNHDIKVRLKNYGGTVLNSATIQWALDGIPQTPISWSTPLDTFGGTLYPNDSAVTLTNLLLGTTAKHLKVWVEYPNNATDTVNINDTIEVTLRSSLNGSYTIGGTSPDYPNLQSAVSDLKSYGVCGPVIFNVAPGSGPYAGNLDFSSISGLSSTNTVVFYGNGASVTSTTSPIIAFSGVGYITLDSFNISGSGSFAGFGIHVGQQSHHLTFNKNQINVGMTATAATNAGIVVSGAVATATTAGNNGRYLTITNNTITGGYYSLVMTGNAGPLDNYGHVITNNTFSDFYAYGVYLANADTVLLSNNNIYRPTRTSAIATMYGIYTTTSRNVKILSNRIHDFNGTAAYGITLANTNNPAGYETEVINNVIYNFNNSSTFYGIYTLTTNGAGIKIHHNTIQYETVSANTAVIRGVFLSIAPNTVSLRNNIISITGGGTGIKTGIYVTTTSASFVSNNNVLHIASTATNNIGYWTTARVSLADWQTASSQDANSVIHNPVFTAASSGNLTPLSTNIDNIGTNVGVTLDITGASRSATTPDPGSYEFTGISGDMAITSGSLIRSGVCYSSTDTLSLTVANLIGNTVTFSNDPLFIHWNISGPVNSSGTITINSGSLNVGASFTVSPNIANLSQAGNYILTAYIEPNAVNSALSNDTLSTPVAFNVQPLLSVAQRNFTVSSPTDSVIIQANSPLFPSSAFLFTEVCHYKVAAGAPAGGWPAYLIADDYVEITGVPNSDLGGYTLEQWSTTALVSTYTFPTGTLVSPNGTAIIAVGQLSTSVPVPASFYYHGNGSYTGNFDSGTTPTGRILKNSSGVIVDVVTYSGSSSYAFPVAAGVSASDWSGNTPVSTSTSGLRLNGPDINNASNWALASASAQDPNTLNNNVPLPTPATLTGFSWSYLGSPVSSSPRTTVGPYTVPGVYAYVATYTNICGTFYDTVFVTATSGVPVKLLSFSGMNIERDALLSWQTASEQNSDHFGIYGSSDGKTFQPLAKINAQGNSNRLVNYTYVDAGAFSKLTHMYYKLKMVDEDGTFEWSNTIKVSSSADIITTLVAPNPFNDQLAITLADRSPVTVRVNNVLGEQIMSSHIIPDQNTIQLNQLSSLVPGVYILSLQQNGNIETIRLIKQ